MSNQLYPIGKQRILAGEILAAHTYKVVGVDLADYTYDAAHDDLADVPVGARVTTATLSGVTQTLGVFDSANWVFAAPTGDQFEALIIFDETHASDALLSYMDSSMVGMPITPAGSDINGIVHSSGWWAL